jgi:hypothetical protein
MKKAILVTVLVIATSVFAHGGKGGMSDSMSFEEQQAKMLGMMSTKQEVMQSNKDCVANASDKAGLSECRDTMRAMRKAQMQERKQNRKGKGQGQG